MKKRFLLAFVLTFLLAPVAMAQSGGLHNGLPPTLMDSFVHEAGENANNIYGDEGGDDPPAMQNFTPDDRIGAGFFGTTNEGLTTGHGSLLPDAWGGDEFIGAEFSVSGPNSGVSGCSGLTISIGPNGVSVSGSLPCGIPIVSGCASISIGCAGGGPGGPCGAGGWGGPGGCSTSSGCAGYSGCGGTGGCSMNGGCGGCSMSAGCGGCGGCAGGGGCGGGCGGGLGGCVGGGFGL